MSFSNAQQQDLLYFDLLITNVDTIYKAPQPVYFNETRTTPFLYCPEDYEMSVVRFTLDTQTLPVIIPPIIPYGPLNNGYSGPDPSGNYGDPNKTIYAVAMTYSEVIGGSNVDFVAEQYITFVAQDQTAPEPLVLVPNQKQDNSQGYYNIYSYQYFIGLINKAIGLCFNDLNGQVQVAGGTLPTTYAPIMTWNTANSTATVNGDVKAFSPFAGNPISLYFNPALAQIFSTLPFSITNSTNISNIDAFRAYQLLFTYVAEKTEQNTQPYPFGSNPQDLSGNYLFEALQCSQELSTTNNWNPVVSIVFTSNTLPIIPSQVTQPLLFVDGVLQTSTSNNNNISNVITDFSAETPLRPFIYYVPTAEFRMISLVGNRPLNNIDVAVYYKTRTADLIPFRLGAGGSASLKILFRKKNYKS